MIIQIMRKTIEIGLIGILVFSLAGAGLTQEKKETKKTTVSKEVTGEVTWIGKNKIAILYQIDTEKSTEYEILLPFDEKELKVIHKKSLEEIKSGDTVTVEYEEITEESEQGGRTDFKARAIKFIRSAVKKPITE